MAFGQVENCALAREIASGLLRSEAPMNFAEAVETLKGGDRVCREGWRSYEYLSSDAEGTCWGINEPLQFNLADFTATDWYVLPLREWTEETNQRR